MQVHRYDDTGANIVNVIDVPIMFAPVAKAYLDRKENYTQEPESTGRRYVMSLPRLSLVLTGINYNSSRSYGVNEFRYFENVNQENAIVNDMFKDSQPTPYDISYNLSFKTDRIGDFSQILENILPYFNPSLYLSVKEFSFLNLERDLKVNLVNVSPEFTGDLDKSQIREANGSIDFVVEAFMYKPVSTAKFIKVINTRFYIGYQEDISATYDGDFSLSAVDATSAGEITASIPDDYNFSSYENSVNKYIFGKRNY
jgi:hypothetical protein